MPGWVGAPGKVAAPKQNEAGNSYPESIPGAPVQGSFPAARSAPLRHATGMTVGLSPRRSHTECMLPPRHRHPPCLAKKILAQGPERVRRDRLSCGQTQRAERPAGMPGWAGAPGKVAAPKQNEAGNSYPESIPGAPVQGSIPAARSVPLRYATGITVGLSPRRSHTGCMLPPRHRHPPCLAKKILAQPERSFSRISALPGPCSYCLWARCALPTLHPVRVVGCGKGPQGRAHQRFVMRIPAFAKMMAAPRHPTVRVIPAAAQWRAGIHATGRWCWPCLTGSLWKNRLLTGL